MEEDNNIKNFSLADIERYHKGLMSPKEMHALEKAAMDDPFLADALEGYSTEGVNAANDIADLQNRLANRIGSKKIVVLPRRYYWMRVAAMIIVIAGAGILAYTLLNKNSKENVAQITKPSTIQDSLQVTDSVNDSNKFLKADSVQSSEGNVSSRNKSFLSLDTIKASTDKTIAGSDTKLKTDTFSLSTANTTRDLASGTIVAAPVVNNIAAPVIASEKKEGVKQKDSLVVIQRKKDDRASEEFALNEVTVVGRPNAKAYKLKDNADKKSAAPLGYGYTFSDSINYNRLNIFRGRVTDTENNGISFANITINKWNVGTYADAKGYFSLVSADSVLNVSLRAVGFNNSQAQLRNNIPTNQVILQEDKSIDAIVMSNKKPNANRSRSAGMVLTEPEPSDGWEKYDDYLANNLKAPDEKGDPQRQGGEVELSFDINSNGEAVNIKVTKSLCKECDAEAIRLVKEGPKWKKKKKKEKGRVTISF